MKTNVSYLTKQSPRVHHWLAKEVIAWVLIIGLFTTLLTYLYIWPHVVLSTFQIAALCLTGSLLTFIPFFQRYFKALNLRYEQELLIRFAFLVPSFISFLLLINYLVPITTYLETHSITGTYDIHVFKNKRDYRYIGIILKNNAYAGVEKIRTVNPDMVPDNPTQVTYTFKKGLIGIPIIKEFSIE